MSQSPPSPAPDWAGHYQREADLQDFHPATDTVEIHRCRAAWSVFPRTPNLSLLDAGCGNGYFCYWISTKIKLGRTVGVDLSAPRVETARKRYPHLEFAVAAADRLPFERGAFDVVTCIEVLEHLEEPAAALRELLRVARRHVIITVPDRQKVRMLLCPHCGKTFPEYGHVQSFDRARLETLAREAGGRMEIVKLYHAPRGARWGIPFWLGGLIARALQWVRPTRATFLAARLAPLP